MKLWASELWLWDLPILTWLLQVCRLFISSRTDLLLWQQTIWDRCTKTWGSSTRPWNSLRRRKRSSKRNVEPNLLTLQACTITLASSTGSSAVVKELFWCHEEPWANTTSASNTFRRESTSTRRYWDPNTPSLGMHWTISLWLTSIREITKLQNPFSSRWSSSLVVYQHADAKKGTGDIQGISWRRSSNNCSLHFQFVLDLSTARKMARSSTDSGKGVMISIFWTRKSRNNTASRFSKCKAKRWGKNIQVMPTLCLLLELCTDNSESWMSQWSTTRDQLQSSQKFLESNIRGWPLICVDSRAHTCCKYLCISFFFLLTLLGKGNANEAQTLFLQAISVQQKALGKEHPEVARIMDTLATLYRGGSSYLFLGWSLQITHHELQLEHFLKRKLCISRPLPSERDWVPNIWMSQSLWTISLVSISIRASTKTQVSVCCLPQSEFSLILKNLCAFVPSKSMRRLLVQVTISCPIQRTLWEPFTSSLEGLRNQSRWWKSVLKFSTNALEKIITVHSSLCLTVWLNLLPEVAEVCQNYGAMSFKQGKFEKAKELWTRELKIWKSVNTQVSNVIQTLSRLAQVCKSLGQNDQAELFTNEATALTQSHSSTGP